MYRSQLRRNSFMCYHPCEWHTNKEDQDVLHASTLYSDSKLISGHFVHEQVNLVYPRAVYSRVKPTWTMRRHLLSNCRMNDPSNLIVNEYFSIAADHECCCSCSYRTYHFALTTSAVEVRRSTGEKLWNTVPYNQGSTTMYTGVGIAIIIGYSIWRISSSFRSSCLSNCIRQNASWTAWFDYNYDIKRIITTIAVFSR